jgi:hypothetical protein
MSTALAILGFFIHQPLSSRYAKYFQVLVPLHWVFWGVPTHTETSFRYLRTQAESIRESTLKLKSDVSGENVDLDMDYDMNNPTFPGL